MKDCYTGNYHCCMKKDSLVLFLLVCLMAISAFSQTNNFLQNRIINVDLTKTNGKFNTMFKECIGAGRANEGLRANWQQQLAYVRKECGFEYIRMPWFINLKIKKQCGRLISAEVSNTQP